MATYPEYLAIVETLLAAPAATARELAAAEADHEAAQRMASESLVAPQRLAAYASQRVDSFLVDARALVGAAGLDALLPQHIRPAAMSAEPSVADISGAETAVAQALEALRLAVLRHRQLERDAAEEARRSLEARRRAEESARLRAQQLAAARAARRRALLVVVVLALCAIAVIVLR